MKIGLKLARYGMNMEEATIARWHKAVGEPFRAGEILYAIETEKVTQDVEALSDGTMVDIVAAEGETVAVGDIVCHVDAALPGKPANP